MTIEAEFYSYKNKGRKRSDEPALEGETSIQPGSSEIINYLSPLRVLATLNIDNSKGTVLVGRSNNKPTVRLYRNEDDAIGVRLDPAKPMQLKEGEELVLMQKAKKRTDRTLKEISLVLFPDEYGDDVPIPTSSYLF